MAIVALWMVEQRNVKAGYPMHDHFQLQMEGDYIVHPDGDYVHGGIDPCFEAAGSGEKHVKILPRAPHYEVWRRSLLKIVPEVMLMPCFCLIFRLICCAA